MLLRIENMEGEPISRAQLETIVENMRTIVNDTKKSVLTSNTWKNTLFPNAETVKVYEGYIQNTEDDLAAFVKVLEDYEMALTNMDLVEDWQAFIKEQCAPASGGGILRAQKPIEAYWKYLSPLRDKMKPFLSPTLGSTDLNDFYANKVDELKSEYETCARNYTSADTNASGGGKLTRTDQKLMIKGRERIVYKLDKKKVVKMNGTIMALKDAKKLK
jgi:hypothetical protein